MGTCLSKVEVDPEEVEARVEVVATKVKATECVPRRANNQTSVRSPPRGLVFSFVTTQQQRQEEFPLTCNVRFRLQQ